MRRSRATEAALLSAVFTALGTSVLAQDLPLPDLKAIAAMREDLQLEVWINSRNTGLVAAVEREADGRLRMRADEMRAVGLAAPGGEGLVALDGVPGLSATYDDLGQRLMVTADVDQLAIQRFDLSVRREAAGAPRQDLGAVLNYVFSADAGQVDADDDLGLDAIGLALDGRVFGRFGTLSSGLSANRVGDATRLVRLDTTWSWYDPERMLGLRGGDYINGGFAWTRPIRMAGFQVRRDFATRPDILTMPSPRLAATAAAPSTLELYVNDNRILSRPVGAGPIRIDGLPSGQGYSNVRLVLADAAGREVAVDAPFFATPLLLRKGLADFSAEAGFARRGFGVESADYAGSPVASASLRYGVLDALTLEGHVEAGAGLVQGGGGLTAQFGGLGVVSASAAASRVDGRAGALAAVVFDSRFAGFYISGMSMRASAGYRDLASVTSRPSFYRNWRMAGDEPPRAIDQVTVSTPLRLAPLMRNGDAPVFSASYSAQTPAAGPRRQVWSGSLRHTLADRVTAYVTAYASRGERRDTGAFLGVSIPLGSTGSATTGVQSQGGDTFGFVEASRAETQASGSYGWRARIEQGARQGAEAQAAYRGHNARVSGAVQYADGAARAQVQVEGAVAWLGGVAAVTNRLEGSFAMVEVGAPDVPVLYQNQKVGRSDRNGRLLVRNLEAFDVNRLSIDSQDLPLELEVAQTERAVTPMAGGGAVVRFGVGKSPPAVLLTLKRPDGSFVPAGAEVIRAGVNERAIVGYDGQTFLTGVAGEVELRVIVEDGNECLARLALGDAAREGGRHVVEAVCR
ncbi:fimbria/pilus outer membrane usher protein [Caulobacter endophyticus]|uniref:fimbria/pilus outer membrane usher protein n=1 Tax=Caulobacter endophyticus TaxID=2172652 RepID=UPI00240F7D22|nr:fimbria/pilus outer membrane usher protein [Caulobacter endophyticus]MDG2531414.1 fimbria/pilus outer membrane usher protein [Caulobacter endophyticus]